ncbi:hypothetical protein ACFQ6N_20215 [Kitasatospora sp. NPDC056446]|uniref:hypothetical protein n=1 Tax=Kitasatospora sp. NPDC056446 TaxID=3345819 RepID=UPI0036C1B26B
MITPGRLRLLHAVIDTDPAGPSDVIVPQFGLGAGEILQRAGLLPGSGGLPAAAPVGAPALAGCTHHR